MQTDRPGAAQCAPQQHHGRTPDPERLPAAAQRAVVSGQKPLPGESKGTICLRLEHLCTIKANYSKRTNIISTIHPRVDPLWGG